MTDNNFIKIIKCPFCCSENVNKYRQRSDSLWVLLCSECDLGFVEKYPKSLQDLYEIDYYEKGIDCTDDSQSVGYSDYTKIDYNYFLWSIALVSLTNAKDSIFDLGCSNGIFLDLAKMHGFNILSGVEYNPEYANICREKGYDVYSQSFIDIDFDKSEKFEIVTAWAVLEHIPELNDVFKKIKFILKPDGFLFFEVPCLTFDETADNYWLTSSLEHIYYFTEKSFKRIISHFFEQAYIGRVVDFENYGATIVGFISPSKSKMEDLKTVTKYLQSFNQDDLKDLPHTTLINYLIFHLRYTNDLESSRIISHHISNSINHDSDFSDYIISFLSQNYIKLYQDNVEYLKAKKYFLGEIEKLQSQLIAIESSKSNEIEKIQSQLIAIESSKFWKLRKRWFQFRRLIGIVNDSKGFSLKTIIHNITSKFYTQKDPIHENKQEEWEQNLPLISVIIPCFNYGEYVEEAIDSILNQTFQDFEIIVVDGGSTDNSTVTTLENLKKLKTTIYYRQGRHLVGDNRNFGIEKARGKYICCLDADDKIEETYLEKALFLLEVYAYDIVSTSVQCFGGSTKKWHIPLNPTLDKIVQYNQVSTVAVYSQTMWNKANGYHDYGIGKDYIVEDWDLWVRMLAIGARVINISEPLMLYRIHDKVTSLSNHPEAISLIEQANTIISFNQKYITPQAYKNSIDNNRRSYKVINCTRNLTKSYTKTQDRNKLKIIFALPFVIAGGADTVLLQIANHLSDNNFDVSIMTTVKTDPSLGNNTIRYKKITKKIYHLYNFLDSQSKWIDFVYYYLESHKIDIIFIVGSSYFYEILPKIKKDFPNIKIIDQLYNTYGHIHNNRKYAQLIDINIVENKAIETCLLSKYAEKPQKVKLIQNGTNLQYFTHDTSLFRPQIIPEEKFIVTFLGRISEEKSPELFVEIATNFKDNERVHFIMGGQGPLFNSIQKKIDKYGLAKKVTLVGLVDSRHYLSYTNLLILPSTIDGRPNSVLESLSMGVPVIASAIGGLPEIIQDGYNGFLCQSGNVNDFVYRVNQLLDDEQLYLSMKKNARVYAVKNLDASVMHQNYLDTFRSLFKSGSDQVIK